MRYKPGVGCFNGLAVNVKFDFSGLGVTLPNTVVYGISYNKTHYGPSPIGESAPWYCDGGAAGVSTFRLDSPSSGCWGALVPAVQFTASRH